MRFLKFAAIAAIVLAAGRASADQINYDPTSGNLSLINAAPDSASLDDFSIFLVNPINGNGIGGNGQAVSDWVFNKYSVSGNHSMQWHKLNAGAGNDVLADGSYLLATLAPSLTDADFGWKATHGGTSTTPFGGNSTGSVIFGSDSGQATYANVNIVAVPEPGTVVLLVVAAIVACAARRRRVAV